MANEMMYSLIFAGMYLAVGWVMPLSHYEDRPTFGQHLRWIFFWPLMLIAEL